MTASQHQPRGERQCLRAGVGVGVSVGVSVGVGVGVDVQCVWTCGPSSKQKWFEQRRDHRATHRHAVKTGQETRAIRQTKNNNRVSHASVSFRKKEKSKRQIRKKDDTTHRPLTNKQQQQQQQQQSLTRECIFQKKEKSGKRMTQRTVPQPLPVGQLAGFVVGFRTSANEKQNT